MKKILCLALAILMTFALFGCNSNTAKPAATSSAPAATKAPAATTAPTAGSATTAPAVAKDSSKQATLVYLCGSLTVAWCKLVSESMEAMGAKYNFKVIAGDSNNDPEKMIQLAQTYCDQKVDGFVFNAQEDLSVRIAEICTKAKIPFMFESTLMQDANKKLLTAGAELDAYASGEICGKWIADNYKKVGFDKVDVKKVGLITIVNSAFESFVNRGKGAMDALKAGFPGAQAYPLDVVSQGNDAWSAAGGYNMTAATIAAHPDVELWCVVAVLADWGQGATRAIEAAKLDKKSIVSTVGCEILPTDWDKGYSGCWMSCNYFTTDDFAKQLVPALMSVVRGEKTMKEVLPQNKVAGQDYGDFRVNGVMVTKDTYKTEAPKHKLS